MEYTIKLNHQDVVDVIAKNFNVTSNQISFEGDDVKVEVTFNKDVIEPEHKIGFC